MPSPAASAVPRRPSLAPSHHVAAATALTGLSAVLWYWAFPPQPLGWLAWVAPLPVTVAQFRYAASDRQARLLQALAICLPLAALFWYAFPFRLTERHWGTFGPLVVLGTPALAIALLGVPLFGGALYVTGLPAGWPSLHRRTNYRLFVLLPALGWAGLDFVRLQLELGHMWGALYSTQWAAPPVLRLAHVGGPWLLSAAVAAGGALLSLAVLAFWPNRRAQAVSATRQERDTGASGVSAQAWERRTLSAHGAVLLICAVFVLTAYLVLPVPPSGLTRDSQPPASTTRVAALQPGLDMADYQDLASSRDYVALARAALPDLERLTMSAAARGAQLIVWPEAALWVDPRSHPEVAPRLRRLAQAAQAHLLITWFIEDDPAGYRNEATILRPDGAFAAEFYAKQHPIRFVGEQSVTRGPLPVFALSLPGLAEPARVSIMMGYDLAFSDTARTLTQRGAQVIVLGTHDWVEMTAVYSALTAVRAAENGVTVVKADWRTGSAIAAPDGRPLARAPVDRNESVVVVADVPVPRAPGGVYTRMGDFVGWLSVAGCAVLLGWAHLRSGAHLDSPPVELQP